MKSERWLEIGKVKTELATYFHLNHLRSVALEKSPIKIFFASVKPLLKRLSMVNLSHHKTKKYFHLK